MLRPTKHAHPDKTVIAVATFMLAALRDNRAFRFDDLLALLKDSREGTESLFLPALNLLYLFGLVEYRSKTDSFEYVGR